MPTIRPYNLAPHLWWSARLFSFHATDGRLESSSTIGNVCRNTNGRLESSSTIGVRWLVALLSLGRQDIYVLQLEVEDADDAIPKSNGDLVKVPPTTPPLPPQGSAGASVVEPCLTQR